MRALARSRITPLIRLRIPDLRTKLLAYRILHRSCRISRSSFSTTAWPLYVKFVQCAMIQEHSRKRDLPVTAAHRLEGIGLCSLPVVEISYQVYLVGIRSPLAEDPVAFFILMHSVIHMVVYTLGQGSVHAVTVLKVHDHLVPSVNDALVWLEPLVGVIDHAFLLCTHISILTFTVMIPHAHRGDIRGKHSQVPANAS